MLKHLLSAADQALAVDDRSFNAVFVHQIAQCLLALDLRKFAEVAITPEKVERVKDQPVLSACGEVGLEFGEVGPAFMDDHHLTIDDGLAGNIEGTDNSGDRFIQSWPLRDKARFLPLLAWSWTR
jgi:hypothetical protein